MKGDYLLRYLPHWFRLLWINKALPKVHVIGDSHASFCFTNIIPVKTKNEQSLFFYQTKKKEKKKIPFSIHWMGPMTMHRVGRDGMKAVNLSNLQIRNGDVAVFVFGEIDVRCHIEKQSISQQRSWEEVMDDLSCRYIKTILENKKQFHHLSCVVCGVIPPTDRSFNVKYPFYGELETRVKLTQALNRKLQDLCTYHDLIFLDLYPDFSSKNGDLKKDVSDGGVHISPSLNDQVKQKLLALTEMSMHN